MKYENPILVDKFLATKGWIFSFPIYTNFHLPKTQYDHNHIVLDFKNDIGRPIALSNVFMKIITKSISNRLKKILPNIISENQSPFFQNSLISDNTMIAFEIFNYPDKAFKIFIDSYY